jgi:hypothetical protein
VASAVLVRLDDGLRRRRRRSCLRASAVISEALEWHSVVEQSICCGFASEAFRGRN